MQLNVIGHYFWFDRYLEFKNALGGVVRVYQFLPNGYSWQFIDNAGTKLDSTDDAFRYSSLFFFLLIPYSTDSTFVQLVGWFL